MDARRLLDTLRDGEPGPGHVDVTEAVRAGRRRVRLRRGAGLVATVASVVLVAVLVAGLGRLTSSSKPRPAAPPGSFDVLRKAFRVGSAGGFTPYTYETGRFRQRVVLHGTGTATVTMYAKGVLPEPSGSAAPDVDGHPARWTHGGIAWEWTPGGWAIVTGTDRDRSYKVALSVRSGPGDPLRPPVKVAGGALHGLHLIGAVEGPFTLAVRYADRDPRETGGDWIELGVQQTSGLTANAEIGAAPVSVRPTRIDFLDHTGRYAAVSSPAYLAATGGAPRLQRLAESLTATAPAPSCRPTPSATSGTATPSTATPDGTGPSTGTPSSPPNCGS